MSKQQEQPTGLEAWAAHLDAIADRYAAAGQDDVATYWRREAAALRQEMAGDAPIHREGD